jgi:Flp pilus assembly protein TadG
MQSCQKRRLRHGAAAVEAAFVLPAFFALLLGLIIGGIAILRFQQTACIAREVARFASVHGSDRQLYADSPRWTVAEIANQVVVPRLLGMDPASLVVRIDWIDVGVGNVVDWDVSKQLVLSLDDKGNSVSCHARVTVQYAWSPRWGGVHWLLTSVSEQPMEF